MSCYFLCTISLEIVVYQNNKSKFVVDYFSFDMIHLPITKQKTLHQILSLVGQVCTNLRKLEGKLVRKLKIVFRENRKACNEC